MLAAVTVGLRDVAPSTEPHEWFGHAPARWKEFQARYPNELREKKDALDLRRRENHAHTVTRVYAARDEQHSEAFVLKRVLESRR